MTYYIDNSWVGKSINSYLKYEQGYSSRSITKLRKLPDGILKNGVFAKTTYLLMAGDRLEVNFPTEENDVDRCHIPVPIIYEDDWIVVFDKPPFMATHMTKAKVSDTLANVYAAHCEKIGLFSPFRPIGRLDKNTSGLLVAAKNKHAATLLQHGIEKVYYGFGCGTLPGQNGVIEASIGRPDPELSTRAVMENGQYAKTAYRCFGSFGGYSFCEFKLFTGRTHQIRAHMAYMGAPLAGDEMYGGDCSHIDRHALHCGSVCFIHPKTKKSLCITSVLPPDMIQILRLPYKKEAVPKIG